MTRMTLWSSEGWYFSIPKQFALIIYCKRRESYGGFKLKFLKKKIKVKFGHQTDKMTKVKKIKEIKRNKIRGYNF